MTGATKVTEHLAPLPWFNPDTITYKELLMILGPRKTGKSTLLFHWILHMAPKIVNPLVISHTEGATHWFEKKVGIPPQFIWNEYSDHIISNAFKRQRMLRSSPPPGYDYANFCATHIFMEDLMNQGTQVFRTVAMNTLTKNGRHDDLGGTILSQYMTCVTKDNRAQFERVALLFDSSHSNRIAAHANFFGGISWEIYNYYYSEATENHGALIYSQTGTRYTKFRADINLLNNAENIDIQWHPCATFKTFAEYYPIEKDNELEIDYSKSAFGLSSLLPGLLRESTGKKRK